MKLIVVTVHCSFCTWYVWTHHLWILVPVCVDVGAYVCHTELDTLWVVHICWSFSFFVYKEHAWLQVQQN